MQLIVKQLKDTYLMIWYRKICQEIVAGHSGRSIVHPGPHTHTRDTEDRTAGDRTQLTQLEEYSSSLRDSRKAAGSAVNLLLEPVKYTRT